MKALWCSTLYVVIETYDSFIELEAMDSDARVSVPLSDPDLIIDPTDGDLDEAEAVREYGRQAAQETLTRLLADALVKDFTEHPPRPHCSECPHIDYLTVSCKRHEHECCSCGERFIDPNRTKVYFGTAAEKQ